MKIRLSSALALLLGCSVPAFANPVTNLGPILFTPVALFAETFIVATLLSKLGFRYSKVFFAWLFITLATYGVMNLAIGFLGIDPSRSNILSSLKPLLFAEALIVLAEAGIMMLMSRSKRFRDSDTRFTWRSALMVSLIGNLVSFGISLLASFIFIPAGGLPLPSDHVRM
jgi:hypothetical protein